MEECNSGFPVIGPHTHFRRGLWKASQPKILLGSKFLVAIYALGHFGETDIGQL